MEFCKKLCKKWIFFFQNDSVENSLICPRTKSASHCPTELFPIYSNNHWTIRRRDNHIVVPSSDRIKLKIDGFYVCSNKIICHNCIVKPWIKICMKYKLKIVAKINLNFKQNQKILQTQKLLRTLYISSSVMLWPPAQHLRFTRCNILQFHCSKVLRQFAMSSQRAT